MATLHIECRVQTKHVKTLHDDIPFIADRFYSFMRFCAPVNIRYGSMLSVPASFYILILVHCNVIVGMPASENRPEQAPCGRISLLQMKRITQVDILTCVIELTRKEIDIASHQQYLQSTSAY